METIGRLKQFGASCTEDKPNRDLHEFQHPDAVIIGECYEGCCDKHECPHCGKRWDVEHS